MAGIIKVNISNCIDDKGIDIFGTDLLPGGVSQKPARKGSPKGLCYQVGDKGPGGGTVVSTPYQTSGGYNTTMYYYEMVDDDLYTSAIQNPQGWSGFSPPYTAPPYYPEWGAWEVANDQGLSTTSPIWADDPSFGGGENTTAAMISYLGVDGGPFSPSGNASNPLNKSAAALCTDLVTTVNNIDFKDWFLPSAMEWQEVGYHMFPPSQGGSGLLPITFLDDPTTVHYISSPATSTLSQFWGNEYVLKFYWTCNSNDYFGSPFTAGGYFDIMGGTFPSVDGSPNTAHGYIGYPALAPMTNLPVITFRLAKETDLSIRAMRRFVCEDVGDPYVPTQPCVYKIGQLGPAGGIIFAIPQSQPWSSTGTNPNLSDYYYEVDRKELTKSTMYLSGFVQKCNDPDYYITIADPGTEWGIVSGSIPPATTSSPNLSCPDTFGWGKTNTDLINSFPYQVSTPWGPNPTLPNKATAAFLCSDYEKVIPNWQNTGITVTYDDWFLPSYEEMLEIKTRLPLVGITTPIPQFKTQSGAVEEAWNYWWTSSNFYSPFTSGGAASTILNDYAVAFDGLTTNAALYKQQIKRCHSLSVLPVRRFKCESPGIDYDYRYTRGNYNNKGCLVMMAGSDNPGGYGNCGPTGAPANSIEHMIGEEWLHIRLSPWDVRHNDMWGIKPNSIYSQGGRTWHLNHFPGQPVVYNFKIYDQQENMLADMDYEFLGNSSPGLGSILGSCGGDGCMRNYQLRLVSRNYPATPVDLSGNKQDPSYPLLENDNGNLYIAIKNKTIWDNSQLDSVTGLPSANPPVRGNTANLTNLPWNPQDMRTPVAPFITSLNPLPWQWQCHPCNIAYDDFPQNGFVARPGLYFCEVPPIGDVWDATTFTYYNPTGSGYNPQTPGTPGSVQTLSDPSWLNLLSTKPTGREPCVVAPSVGVKYNYRFSQIGIAIGSMGFTSYDVLRKPGPMGNMWNYTGAKIGSDRLKLHMSRFDTLLNKCTPLWAPYNQIGGPNPSATVVNPGNGNPIIPSSVWYENNIHPLWRITMYDIEENHIGTWEYEPIITFFNPPNNPLPGTPPPWNIGGERPIGGPHVCSSDDCYFAWTLRLVSHVSGPYPIFDAYPSPPGAPNVPPFLTSQQSGHIDDPINGVQDYGVFGQMQTHAQSNPYFIYLENDATAQLEAISGVAYSQDYEDHAGTGNDMRFVDEWGVPMTPSQDFVWHKNCCHNGHPCSCSRYLAVVPPSGIVACGQGMTNFSSYPRYNSTFYSHSQVCHANETNSPPCAKVPGGRPITAPPNDVCAEIIYEDNNGNITIVKS